MQVHYNCHIKTMSYAVKRQGEIKSFQFLFEGSCADFVSDVSRESIPCGRARKRERSLAEFCSKAWHVIQAAVSRSQTSRRSGRNWLNNVCQIHRWFAKPDSPKLGFRVRVSVSANRVSANRDWTEGRVCLGLADVKKYGVPYLYYL